MSIVRTLTTIVKEINKNVWSAIWSPINYKYVMCRHRNHPARSDQTLNWIWDDKPNRVAVVNMLLQGNLNGSYLEIGCDSNALFNSVMVREKVGVDPARGGTVREESDIFFNGNKRKFDVIWIDGLHTYEQVRRDVINAIEAINPGGWVGIHDLLPRTWVESHVPRLFDDGAWSGDVWKVAFELNASPMIDFRIINIDRGVGVFRILDSSAKLTDLSRELTDSNFDYLCKEVNRLPIIECDDAFNWIRDVKMAQ